jgi:hypothetical protein
MEFICVTILFVLFVCLAIAGFCETVEEIKREIKGKK